MTETWDISSLIKKNYMITSYATCQPQGLSTVDCGDTEWWIDSRWKGKYVLGFAL